MFNQARGVTAIQYTNASYRDRIYSMRTLRRMYGTPRKLRQESRTLEAAAELLYVLDPSNCPGAAEHKEEMLSWASAKAALARNLRWINA